MGDLAERLAARTLELIDIPSESRAEAPLAAHVEAVLRAGGVPVRDMGDSCVLAGDDGAGVVLAGHLDTVPAQDNLPGRIDGDRVHGLGASDMKGAVAVALELALAGAPVRCLFFGREELPQAESALTPLLGREPFDAALVVMMEPTGCELHAGCLGNINATWSFHGRSGHSARPWLADNAIERAAAGILALAAQPPRPHTVDGLEFVEVATVTRIAAGIAGNVIPDRAELPPQLPLRPRAQRRRRRGPAGRAVRRPRRAADRLQRALGPCGGRRGGRRADGRRQPGPRAQAGVDAGGRVRAGRAVRGQLRAGRAGPGPPARRVGRDRGPGARLRGAGAVRAMRPSPVLAGLQSYPFLRLSEARRRLQAAQVPFVDFGMGEPREETPAFIRAALAEAIEPLSLYPENDGLPALREAVAAWVGRRFGPALDPDTQIVPTMGSKESIFHLAHVLDGDLVAVPTPAYPVYERGAAFFGKQVLELPLREENGFLPDLDAVEAATWRRVAILWLNYPNNPTGATAPLALYERAAALAREHGFVLASDEAYSEIYFGAPPVSALELPDLTSVAVFNTLSKRSSMPGYRSGFVAGDPELIALIKRYRPNVGVAPQSFIQRAAAAAWGDEAHVEAVRAGYRAKRDVLLPVLQARGLRHAGGDASFFLWLDARPDAEALAERLLEGGIVLAPGSFFGPAGAGYLRLALVPTLAGCERAAHWLDRLLR